MVGDVGVCEEPEVEYDDLAASTDVGEGPYDC